MKNHLKPMGVRDILDSTFTIMRENFWSLQGIFFKAFFPSLIILFAGIIGAVVYLALLGTHTDIPITNPLFWSEAGHGSTSVIILGIVGLLLVALAFIVAAVIGDIYYTYGVLKIFKNGLHDQKTSSKEAFRGVKGNRARIFWVQFVVGLLLYIVILPGVVISVNVNLLSPLTGTFISYANNFLQLVIAFFFCMTSPVVVYENLKVMKSIGRGIKLLSHHRWRIFWTLLLVYLLGYALGLILLGFIAIPIVVAAMLKNMIAYIIAAIFGIGASFLLVLLVAYFYGPLAAIYYDLIIRKEGYDISVQLAEAAQAGTEGQSTAQPTSF